MELIWQPLLDMKIFSMIDRYKMSQVIRNLVSNALKFSKEKSTIFITAVIIPGIVSNNTARTHVESPRPTRNGGSRIAPEADTRYEPPNHTTHSFFFGCSLFEACYNCLFFAEDTTITTSIYHAFGGHTNSINHHTTPIESSVDMLRISVHDSGCGISKVSHNLSTSLLLSLISFLVFYNIGKSKEIV